MKLLKRRRTDTQFAYLLLAPSLILLLVLIGYPMIYNIIISFQDVPVNPKMASTFIGLNNYISVIKDSTFYNSLAVTLTFTAVVTAFSTIIGLAVAVFLNRDFIGKKLVNAIVILSYVVPSICLIFSWKYIFNNIYGVVNYLFIDILNVNKEVPLWFDNPASAYALVALFAIWRFFPYAYISFNAILQSIDKSLYEAAEIDGANSWHKFLAVTYPAIKPTLATVVSLRIIWVFYIYAEVYLLTTQVDVIGVYLYKMAFATHDFGKAAAISILLFFLIFACILFVRKKVFKSDED
jgi:multiple sugar transport system permease protein